MSGRRTAILFTVLSLLTAALFTADLLIGSVAVALRDIWAALTGGSCDPAVRDIILKIRLLKAVTALFAGAALAASGLQMQTLFRNPLAGPYVLGISSGAGLGVALFLLGAPLLGVSAHSFVQSLSIAGAAWLGAALVLLIVMAVSRRIKDIMVILILGMMFGSGVSSMVEILQYLSSEAALKSFVIWTMGSLGDVTGGNLALMLPVITAGLVLSVAEPAAAGRELRPHDGSQRPAHPHAAVPLHGPARRHRHGLLRPGRIHRTGRAAPRAHALRQRRPPRPDARVDAFGRGPAAGLRPYFQIAGPPDQHRHGPDGHPRGDRRSRPQPQSLLK